MILNQLKKAQLFQQKQLYVNKKKSEKEIILLEKVLFFSKTYFVICDTVRAELCRGMHDYLETLNMFRILFDDNDKTPTMETCNTEFVDAYKDDFGILLLKEEELMHFMRIRKRNILRNRIRHVCDND